MGKGSWSRAAYAGFLLCAAAAVSLAQTFTSLASFNGTDGAEPQYMSLVQGTDGNYYGTTLPGGSNYGGSNSGEGTVFKLTPGGTLTALYSFCVAGYPPCPDGAGPWGSLVLGLDGNFYGTTVGGGYEDGGTIFKITLGGTLTTIYEFHAYLGEGTSPHGALAIDSEGNFYGTTWGGGADGLGTVYKVTPGGAMTTLHSFDGNDGSNPWGELVQGMDGNLYGTTTAGGNVNVGGCAFETGEGCGTIFKITPTGTLTTLYSFCAEAGCPDGYGPIGPLVEGEDGNFYGVTEVHEPGGSWGTVFKVTPDGTLTTLHTFCSEPNCADGFDPAPGLARGTDGNFYGGTGSSNVGYGTLFRITQGGVLTTLYTFGDLGLEGDTPGGPLFQATNGNFYGTTLYGGANNDGTVYKLSVGLGPFVETNPTSGHVGSPVIILGNGLTGATGVSFNGTAAKFIVVSNSEIKTTVPAGATTGKVKVTMPAGTLTSNVPFQATGPCMRPLAQ
jgi:uncharacterized repeat protein (TIGR03803 family)